MGSTKRLVIASDSHLGFPYPFSTSPHPYKDVFFRYSCYAAKVVIEYAVTHDCDILYLGDFFEAEKIGSPEFSIGMQLLQMVGVSNISLYMVVGNHEIDYKEDIPSVIQSMAALYPNIHISKVRSRKQEYLCDTYRWNDFDLVTVPYSDQATFNKRFETLCASESLGVDRPCGLCIHQNIKGIRLGGGASIKEGMGEREFVERMKGKFKFLACGHLHTPYISNKFGMPIIIPGSTAAIDFKDEHPPTLKGFVVADFSVTVPTFEAVPIFPQIVFFTIDMANKFRLLEDYRDRFIKVKHKLHQLGEYEELKVALMERGAVGVVPEVQSERVQPDSSAYERPVQIVMNDWLETFLAKRFIEGEDAQAVMDLNEEVFPA